MKESTNHQLKTKLAMIDFRMSLTKHLIGDYVENEQLLQGIFPRVLKRKEAADNAASKRRHVKLSTHANSASSTCVWTASNLGTGI